MQKDFIAKFKKRLSKEVVNIWTKKAEETKDFVTLYENPNVNLVSNTEESDVKSFANGIDVGEENSEGETADEDSEVLTNATSPYFHSVRAPLHGTAQEILDPAPEHEELNDMLDDKPKPPQVCPANRPDTSRSSQTTAASLNLKL